MSQLYNSESPLWRIVWPGAKRLGKFTAWTDTQCIAPQASPPLHAHQIICYALGKKTDKSWQMAPHQNGCWKICTCCV
uniref:Uncharacterized protein n=1 Tax=Anguilla anguilla TaxID=7936 RepID=A0A0E9UT03_ANGAN